MKKIAKGTWVEVERVLLTPAERAPNLPEDTRACPYVLRLHGFLQEDAEPGQTVKVRTLIGLEQAGILREGVPGYTHSFGTTVPELLVIGTEDRR
jgi:hypothetical protein